MPAKWCARSCSSAPRELAYSAYVSALAVNALMNALIAGCSAWSRLRWWVARTSCRCVASFLLLALLSGLGLVLPSVIPSEGSSRHHELRRKLRDGTALVRADHGFGVLGALAGVKFGLNAAVRVMLSFQALGQPISWTNAAMLGAASVVASVVNVAPGNLGIREFVLGAAAGAAGGSPVPGDGCGQPRSSRDDCVPRWPRASGTDPLAAEAALSGASERRLGCRFRARSEFRCARREEPSDLVHQNHDGPRACGAR
jgi:hypothetical protein